MKNKKLNRKQRRKAERKLGKYRLKITHKKTKEKLTVKIKFATKPTIDQMFQAIRIEGKPVNKADYDYKVRKIKGCR